VEGVSLVVDVIPAGLVWQGLGFFVGSLKAEGRVVQVQDARDCEVLEELAFVDGRVAAFGDQVLEDLVEWLYVLREVAFDVILLLDAATETNELEVLEVVP